MKTTIGLVDAMDEFPYYYFEEINSLLFNVWCLHTRAHTYTKRIFTVLLRNSSWVFVRWRSFYVKLEELQNLPPGKPQFHIQRLKTKQSSHNLNIHQPNKSSRIIKYWLVYTSLINYSLLKYSFLFNTKKPVLTY